MTILPLSLVHVCLLSQQQIEPALLSNPDKTDQEEGIPTHVQQIRTYHQYTEEQTCQIPLTPQDYTGHIPLYIRMYVHMYVTMSSRFLYKVYTITPVQCHTPVAVSLHMDTGGLQGMDYLQFTTL